MSPGETSGQRARNGVALRVYGPPIKGGQESGDPSPALTLHRTRSSFMSEEEQQSKHFNRHRRNTDLTDRDDPGPG